MTDKQNDRSRDSTRTDEALEALDPAVAGVFLQSGTLLECIVASHCFSYHVTLASCLTYMCLLNSINLRGAIMRMQQTW